MNMDRIAWVLVWVGLAVLLVALNGCVVTLFSAWEAQQSGNAEDIENANRTYALWLWLFTLSPAVMFLGAVLRAVTPPKNRAN